MSLDPGIEMILNQINSMPAVPMREISPEDFRDQQVVLPEPVVEVGKVYEKELALEGRNLTVRVYVPQSAGSDPLPALVFYHGGGWVVGNLDSHDSVCRVLANESDCIVLSVDYRLAPEHKFPTAVDDAYDALVEIVARASEFQIDPERIAVGGDSAGGNLAAVTSIIAKERKTPQIQFQLLIYPSTGFAEEPASFRENGEGYFLTLELMQWFRHHYLRDESDDKNPYFSPVLYPDLSGLPPAFIATAEFDPLRDVGQEYAQKLRAAGVTTQAKNYEGMIHGFANFHAYSAGAKTALVECARTLHAALYD